LSLASGKNPLAPLFTAATFCHNLWRFDRLCFLSFRLLNCLSEQEEAEEAE
jgi:hypothetical protein